MLIVKEIFLFYTYSNSFHSTLQQPYIKKEKYDNETAFMAIRSR